jgi:hypothetical protein
LAEVGGETVQVLRQSAGLFCIVSVCLAALVRRSSVAPAERSHDDARHDSVGSQLVEWAISMGDAAAPPLL